MPVTARPVNNPFQRPDGGGRSYAGGADEVTGTAAGSAASEGSAAGLGGAPAPSEGAWALAGAARRANARQTGRKAEKASLTARTLHRPRKAKQARKVAPRRFGS